MSQQHVSVTEIKKVLRQVTNDYEISDDSIPQSPKLVVLSGFDNKTFNVIVEKSLNKYMFWGTMFYLRLRCVYCNHKKLYGTSPESIGFLISHIWRKHHNYNASRWAISQLVKDMRGSDPVTDDERRSQRYA